MRRFLALLALTALLVSQVPSVADAVSRWPIEKVTASTVKIDIFYKPYGDDGPEFNGHCSGFSVRSYKAQGVPYGLFVSADHCVIKGARYEIEGKPAWPMDGLIEGGKVTDTRYEGEDIVVFLSLDVQKPELEIGLLPQTGETILGMGYGLDSPTPLFFDGLVISLNYLVDDMGYRMYFSNNWIPGMSGGPIINQKGKIVSVVQCGGHPASHYQNIGCGARYWTLAKMIQELKQLGR